MINTKPNKFPVHSGEYKYLYGIYAMDVKWNKIFHLLPGLHNALLSNSVHQS